MYLSSDIFERFTIRSIYCLFIFSVCQLDYYRNFGENSFFFFFLSSNHFVVFRLCDFFIGCFCTQQRHRQQQQRQHKRYAPSFDTCKINDFFYRMIPMISNIFDHKLFSRVTLYFGLITTVPIEVFAIFTMPIEM